MNEIFGTNSVMKTIKKNQQAHLDLYMKHAAWFNSRHMAIITRVKKNVKKWCQESPFILFVFFFKLKCIILLEEEIKNSLGFSVSLTWNISFGFYVQYYTLFIFHLWNVLHEIHSLNLMRPWFFSKELVSIMALFKHWNIRLSTNIECIFLESIFISRHKIHSLRSTECDKSFCLPNYFDKRSIAEFIFYVSHLFYSRFMLSLKLRYINDTASYSKSIGNFAKQHKRLQTFNNIIHT